MKMQVRTLIAIAALGTIGFTNINAIADNKSLVNAEVVTEKEESLTIESWMTNEKNWGSEEVNEADDTLRIESWMTNESLWE